MKKQNETRYEKVKTATLINYANNARTHTETQIDMIAASIQEFGFLNPIIVDQHNVIVAGHGRLMAAKKLGLDLVPCVRVEHLSEAQKKAYILADNRLAEVGSGWDKELLKIEFDDLKELEFDTDIIGFDDDFFDHEFEPNINDTESNTDGRFELIVDCKDQANLEDLFQELNERKFKVKVKM
jgi:hypothetical protein